MCFQELACFRCAFGYRRVKFALPGSSSVPKLALVYVGVLSKKYPQDSLDALFGEKTTPILDPDLRNMFFFLIDVVISKTKSDFP